MKIAKIVSSNSHIDYVGRIIDALDADEPPNAEDFGFAQFVSLPLETEEVIGIIYDSVLVNPDYSSFGPRLSPKPDLQIFSPDYLNEQGILIGILLLGTITAEGVSHGIPRRIVPPGQDVFKINSEQIKNFHLDKNGDLRIHYYSQIVASAGTLAVPLLESIIEQLSVKCSEKDQKRLDVLKQSLLWQRTFSGMRL
jgi:hypothetical protein